MNAAGTVVKATAARRNGFTLIELMVTIAIAAILVLVAAPSFVTYRQNSQLTAAANTFLANAFAARAEAMKRQLNVFVRPAGTDWSAGWTSYVDGDWDNQNNTAGVDVTLSSQGSLTKVTISNDTTPIDPNGSTHYVMFSGAGFLWSIGNTATNSATVAFYNGVETRLVIMEGSGRMRVCNPATDTTCTSSNVF